MLDIQYTILLNGNLAFNLLQREFQYVAAVDDAHHLFTVEHEELRDSPFGMHDAGSMRGFVSLYGLIRKSEAKTKAINWMMAKRKKIQRQESAPMTKPATVGPIIRAVSPNMPTNAARYSPIMVR